MDIFGHRGGVGSGWPVENTIAAVLAARADGADGVEVDVRLSADDVPVCMHDRDLWRLAGHGVEVRSLSYAALLRYPLPGGESIARLDEVVEEVYGRDRLLLDLKGDGVPPAALAVAVVRILRRVGAGEGGLDQGVMVSSFSTEVLDAVRRVGPELRRALITGAEVPAITALSRALAVPGTDVHPHVQSVLADHAVVDRAAEAGVAIRCWTVNRPVDARLLDMAGVAAVITDDPGELRRALADCNRAASRR